MRKNKTNWWNILLIGLLTVLIPTISYSASQIYTSQIKDDAITYAKIQNISTNNRLLGRATAGAGNTEEITLGTNLSYAGTTLNAAGGTVSDGDKGDITVSGSGATWTIDNDAITYAKMQNVSATDTLLGRGTAGAGNTEEITLSRDLDMEGTVLGLVNKKKIEALSTYGLNTFTVIGTTATFGNIGGGTWTNVDAADGSWIQDGVGSSDYGRACTSTAITRYDWNPDITFKIRTPSNITNTNIHYGLWDDTDDISQPTTGDIGASFQYNTNSDATSYWTTFTNDNGSTPTKTTTSVAIAANTIYTLRIKCSASNVLFYVDGVLAATHTTDLPAAATGLYVKAYIDGIGVSKAHQLSKWSMLYDG